jgi:trimethylamine--corrinoid protein Co-methyltransferase
MSVDVRTRHGGGSRRKRAERAGAAKPAAGAWRPLRLTNPYRPIEQFSADQIEAIHDTSMTILEEIGLRILNPEARALYGQAGFAVDEGDRRVRFERAGLLEAVARAPSEVALRARNPERDVTVGGTALAFCTVGGPPNVSDLDGGRRPGTLAAFDDLARLAQSFDVVHLLAPMVEPIDIPAPLRHLHMTRSMVSLTDKVFFVYSRGSQAVADAFEIVRLAAGLTAEAFARTPCCYTVVNANSPLQLDHLMCKGIIDFALHGQLMILTPFTLAGAMAPVTLPGALAQQNAEALAGIALAQLVRPGAPVAYGGFTSNVDMKSGAPAFGTPEYVKAAFASGQLARRYRLPFRSSNVNASNAPDAQATYESQMATWGAVMGGCNILLHGAGWLEGGLTASFEKFIIDVEMLRMFAALLQPVTFDEDALALSALREIEPGGHFFGTQHTLAHYESAFYAPLLSDWRNFETWQETGALDATTRANRIYKQTLADFQPPPLDPAIRDRIDDLVERRAREGGADLET